MCVDGRWGLSVFDAQVHGRKRFRLWGPDAHAALQVFPDAHPRARKAQVLIDSTMGLPAAELDVILEPGEALFIPAFWFHHVEALSPSVSVNVFSENSMKLAAQDILMRPPPDALMRVAADASRPRGAAAEQLSRMAQQLQQLISLDRALASTVAGRYAALAAAAAGTDAPNSFSADRPTAQEQEKESKRDRAEKRESESAAAAGDVAACDDVRDLAVLFRDLEAATGDGECRHQKGVQVRRTKLEKVISLLSICPCPFSICKIQ